MLGIITRQFVYFNICKLNVQLRNSIILKNSTLITKISIWNGNADLLKNKLLCFRNLWNSLQFLLDLGVSLMQIRLDSLRALLIQYKISCLQKCTFNINVLAFISKIRSIYLQSMPLRLSFIHRVIRSNYLMKGTK